MFSLIVSGIGIAFLCIIGISGTVSYFVQYARMATSSSLFDFLLLISMGYSLVALVSGFGLLSLSHLLDHYEKHSNSHVQLMPLLLFLATSSTVGFTYGLLLIIIERYLLIVDPKKHGRLSGETSLLCFNIEIDKRVRWAALFVFTLVVAVASSLATLWQYKITCYDVGEGGHEDFFEVCDSNKRAYVDVTNIMQASRLFRLGTTSLLILLDYVVPVFLMLWCSAVIFMTNIESPRTVICLSQIEKNGFRKLSTRDKELNKRTLVASLLGLFVYAIQSVAYGYEMFSAAYMQHPYATPQWMIDLYEISHFLAFLSPALTFYIFCLPDHLPRIIHYWHTSGKKGLLGGRDTERLLEDETEIRFSSISSIYQSNSSNYQSNASIFQSNANSELDVKKPYFK